MYASKTRRALILGLGLLLAFEALAEPDSPSSMSVPSTASASASAFDMIREGQRFNDAGDYGRALAWWWRWVALDPSHPAPHIQSTDTLFWKMVYDDENTRFDRAIEHECALAISKASRLVRERPEDARAHLFYGQALMQLGRLRGIRLRIYQAGKLGEQAREELERALELDPGLVDARFQLGMYYYYASLVPSLVQWFSWLWFIPTGDGDTGVAYLEEVYEKGDLFRFSAGFFLANIKTYHPGRVDLERAQTILRALHREYPTNPLVHFELLETLSMQERYLDVIEEALRLEANPLPGREAEGRRNMARIWRARANLMLGRPEIAWALLESFGDEAPESPNWGRSWVMATRGQILDVRGAREAAVVQYSELLALGLDIEEYRAVRLANDGMTTPFELPALVRDTSADSPLDTAGEPAGEEALESP